MLTFSLKAHEGVVRGCSYVPGGSHILTCADDKTIKLWDAAKWNDVPVDTIVSKHMVSFVLCTNVDHGDGSLPFHRWTNG